MSTYLKPDRLVPRPPSRPDLTQSPSQRAQVLCSGLSVDMVTCVPGPQIGRLHGTRCRPQTGYKLQVRAAGGRGQGAGSVPAGGPRPLPQIPQICTGGSPLLPWHGLQTLPSGIPQRPGLFRDTEQKSQGREPYKGSQTGGRPKEDKNRVKRGKRQTQAERRHKAE